MLFYKVQNEEISPEEEKEERDIISSLDPYVIIEYIKSSVDIILNLKFEEIEKRLIDKQENPHRRSDADLLRKDKLKSYEQKQQYSIRSNVKDEKEDFPNQSERSSLSH